jgi:NAD-dependent dihydropyrimidine dehydrogenase PreA subunit
MVDIAHYFLAFVEAESCGKCVPCRVGTKRMLEILTRIKAGKGEEDDIDKLVQLGETIKDSSLCGLGQTAPNPVLTTIRYFRGEYEAHIREKKCPGGVCRELIEYYIDEDKCTGCGVCRKKCPQDAITGEKREPHVIDTDKCIECGICRDACKFDAVKVR